MCPGGYVVNASSETCHLAINGMSNYKRDSKNANSAIVVTVNKNDYGDGVFAGMEFQRELESKAYDLGKSNIPLSKVFDYLNNLETTTIGKIKPEVKGSYTLTNLNSLFSQDITESIKEAIIFFGKKIVGFDNPDALLLGIESRTSSPIRIERNEELLSNIKGIYPCGEGAGYAGGITTSAMDGIKVAEEIIKKYHN
jgi:hypothetical protein